MIQERVQRDMRRLTRLHDFLILISMEYNPQVWGYYYPEHRTIIIYAMDEEGDIIDMDSLMRISCHEMTHHMMYHHHPNQEEVTGEELHGEEFKKIFAKLLDKYYNGSIPKETVDVIREEGLLYEPKSKKKRLRRVTKRVGGSIY